MSGLVIFIEGDPHGNTVLNNMTAKLVRKFQARRQPVAHSERKALSAEDRRKDLENTIRETPVRVMIARLDFLKKQAGLN